MIFVCSLHIIVQPFCFTTKLLLCPLPLHLRWQLWAHSHLGQSLVIAITVNVSVIIIIVIIVIVIVIIIDKNLHRGKSLQGWVKILMARQLPKT